MEERIYVEKFAKHNSTIWTWLKKANSLRRYGKQKSDGINGLIQNLGLDGLETENHFDPKNDDLADWFSGSPDWVRRSIRSQILYNNRQIIFSNQTHIR